MKTAMQEIIKYVEMFDNPAPEAVGTILLAIKFKALTLLEKEKEQIVEAANYGLEHFGDIAEKYYNEKYNK